MLGETCHGKLSRQRGDVTQGNTDHQRTRSLLYTTPFIIISLSILIATQALDNDLLFQKHEKDGKYVLSPSLHTKRQLLEGETGIGSP